MRNHIDIFVWILKEKKRLIGGGKKKWRRAGNQK
jgi:hypothetical protein